MAHESFEDQATAGQLNAEFVPVKVDREERPDVDAMTMAAVQTLTGQGGWPTTVFLTPDGEPFHAGTYYPPQPRHGMPSLRQLLTAVTSTWREHPGRVLEAAGQITEALSPARANTGENPSTAVDLDRTADALLADLDPVNGGFTGAPKFPPTLTLEFWLRCWERSRGTGKPRQDLLDAVELTLDRMSRGGLYDQLAGGFARYSVDGTWHVPHFEKMLDDNALLLRVLAHHARLTGHRRSVELAAEVVSFLLRSLLTPEGLFAVALDADTGGVEGGSYLWTEQQLIEVLGAEDAAAAARWFGLDTPAPAPVDGLVLRLPVDPEDPERFAQVRERLLRARSARPQPERDDLVVLRSTCLAITALVEAGATLGVPLWVEAGRGIFDRVMAIHWEGDRWRRSSRDGKAGPGRATLADVAALSMAMLMLHQARPGPEILEGAVLLLRVALLDFDDGAGGFTGTDAGDPTVAVRLRDDIDGAAPCGTSMLAEALLTASAMTGQTDLRERAERILAGAAPLMAKAPRAAGWYLAVAEAAVAGPLQVAIALPEGTDSDLVSTARGIAPGGSVVVAGPPDADGEPLLAGRPLQDGRPTAYVCRGFVCDRPVTTTPELTALLIDQSASTQEPM